MCLCVLEERRMLGVHVCNLSAKTDILNLPGFFSIMCVNSMSDFCSVKLCFKIFQLDIYVLEILFSVKKM